MIRTADDDGFFCCREPAEQVERTGVAKGRDDAQSCAGRRLPDFAAEPVDREADLVEPVGHGPPGAPDIFGNLCCQCARIVGDAGDSEIWQSAQKIEQRPVVRIGAARQLAIETQRDVPRPISRKVAREHQQPQERRIFGARRPIAESPELGMERTFARCSDFDDNAFEQRAEP